MREGRMLAPLVGEKIRSFQIVSPPARGEDPGDPGGDFRREPDGGKPAYE